MAAKGSIAKENVFKRLADTFGQDVICFLPIILYSIGRSV